MPSDSDFDYLIIGAGPAGLQLGYFLQRAGRSYVILEAGDNAGTFFKRFPRHRQLISNNKIHTGYEDPEVNLRFDWNSLLSDSPELLFKHYSRQYFPPADSMVTYLQDYVRHHDLNVRYNSRVSRVSRNGDFRVEDEHGNAYTAKRLVVASGFMKPNVPDIPGIELTENYVDVSVDPQDFVDQRVLVVGKGNSGFETAENLIPTAALIHVASPRPITMAWKTHHVGHLRAVNNNFLDTYQLKSQNAVLDATIERIEKKEGKLSVFVHYSHAQEETQELVYDRVIVCTGFRFDDSIFDESCRPALAIHDRLPAQTSAWESTNVKDLYIAGTLMQMRDYKKITSGFIHGFRYNLRALLRIFEERYHGRPWPAQPVDPSPEGLTEAMIRRINKTSALWQQFGFLGDVFVLSPAGDRAVHYEELPVDYVHDTALGRNAHYYILTLEFGKITGDPFNILRHPEPGRAAESAFLHPVLRRFRGGETVSEHHLLEDLFGEWRDDQLHVQPLLSYLRRDMGAAVLPGLDMPEMPLPAAPPEPTIP
jgi:thioredoxin reductase